MHLKDVVSAKSEDFLFKAFARFIPSSSEDLGCIFKLFEYL